VNVSGLEAREPLHAIVAVTLAGAWSQQHGTPFVVTEEPTAGAQEWRLHRALSVYTRPTIDRATRRFVADRYRFTRSRRKLPRRWLQGTVAASLPAQRWGRPARSLWVSPAVPDADGIVVLPGNQRVRIFDTHRGIVRAVVKDGFGTGSLRAELQVRTSGIPGPYLPITAGGPELGWFEEPLVVGFSLDVCPPWRPYGPLMSAAADRLRDWLDRTAEHRDVGVHAHSIADELSAAARMLDGERGADLSRRTALAMRALVTPLRQVGSWPFSWSHGDLQPGNVLVPDHGPPVFVDWEFSGLRPREYDGLVHGLQTRRSDGRVERTARYVRTGRLEDDLGLVSTRLSRGQRSMLVRLVLLEDLAVGFREVSGAGVRPVPASLYDLLSDVEAVLRDHLPG
jgi:hypothetical protein